MARHFSKDAVEEMRQQLAVISMKDTDFVETAELSGNEQLAIVQDGVNRRITVKMFTEKILDGIFFPIDTDRIADDAVTEDKLSPAVRTKLNAGGGTATDVSFEVDQITGQIKQING